MPLKLVAPRPGKTPYWYVRGTHLGHRVNRSTGLGDRRKAQRALEQIREDIERSALEPARRNTFAAAALSYMQGGGERRFIAPLLTHFGDLALTRLDQAAVDRAAVELYPDATPATRNRAVYTPISAILKHAGVDMAIRRPKGHAGRARTLWISPEQAAKLHAAADPRIRPVFVFLLYTGCRLNEALNLSWEDLALTDAHAAVRMTKNGDPRGVHLPPDVVAAIGNIEPPKPRKKGAKPPADWRRGRVFRFAKGGGFYKLWREMTAAAGLEWVTPHVLCHTWATWMRRYAGTDLRGLIATGRWRDLKSVARYQHVVATEESRAADLLPSMSTKRTKVGEKAWTRPAKARKS